MASSRTNPETPDEGGSDRISMSVTIKRGRATVHSISDFVTTPKVAGQMLKTIAEDLDPAKTGAPWMPHPPGPGIRGGVITNGTGTAPGELTSTQSVSAVNPGFPPED